MTDMFWEADSFNSDISLWDVSRVEQMAQMFGNTHSFNQNIGSWNVSSATNMNNMFSYSESFDQDIGRWNVSNVRDMDQMFDNALAFNQDLTNWCVDSITTAPQAFAANSALSTSSHPNWGSCPANVFNPDSAYADANGCVVCDQYSVGYSFSLDNGVSWIRVVDRPLLEQLRNYRADLSRVCVSPISVMDGLFQFDTLFNDDISSWDVSNVTSMSRMFYGASAFNQPIGNWNTSSVIEMDELFTWTSFDQDIGNWDVSMCRPWRTCLAEILRSTKILEDGTYQM